MAQVPAAPDAGALAARLNDIQDANIGAVAPAPAHPAVQEPQAANPDQPAQGQAQEVQQAPEVCLFSVSWSSLVFRPLFLHFLPVLVFARFLVRPTYRVLFYLPGRVLGSHVVCAGVFLS